MHQQSSSNRLLRETITWTESFPVRTLLGVPLHVPNEPGSAMFSLLEDQARVSWRANITKWSTQYCGFEEKGNQKHGERGRLEATQHNDHHGTFDKLIAESERYADWVMNEELIKAGWMGGWLTLIRPVMVLQGPLYAATVEGESVSLSARDHVHHLRRGIFKERRVAWVVDVVTETGLPSYLDGIAATLEKIRAYCINDRERVQESFKSESTRRLSLMVRGLVR